MSKKIKVFKSKFSYHLMILLFVSFLIYILTLDNYHNQSYLRILSYKYQHIIIEQ